METLPICSRNYFTMGINAQDCGIKFGDDFSTAFLQVCRVKGSMGFSCALDGSRESVKSKRRKCASSGGGGGGQTPLL